MKFKNSPAIQSHKAYLTELASKVENPSVGFFGPSSMHWQLYREPSILFGSFRALLLQVAHPAVADGVRQHSNFKTDYLGRAHRTFTSMIHIWFGDTQQATGSALRLYSIHSMIQGTVYGKKYTANEPHLLLWVLATLVDTTIVAYEKAKGPLSTTEKEQFFQESKWTAQLMGIPLDKYPENWAAFSLYFNQMIHNGSLIVDEVSTTISLDLFDHYYWLKKISRLVAAGFLPPPIRKSYGLAFSKQQEKKFHRLLKISKFVTNLIPPSLRYAPPWHQAHYRLARTIGRSPSLLQRWYHWMGNNIKVYFFYNDIL